MTMIRLSFLLSFVFGAAFAFGQTPAKYEVRDIEVSGNVHTDDGAIRLLSGISIGDSIVLPSDEVRKAIQRLWKQGIFKDIKIINAKQEPGAVWLIIEVVEAPRLGRFELHGVKKRDVEPLADLIRFNDRASFSDSRERATLDIIKNYYQEKGYWNVETKVEKITDPDYPHVYDVHLTVSHDAEKSRITTVEMEGLEHVPMRKAKKILEHTRERKWYNPTLRTRFIEGLYEEDKKALKAYLDGKGLRDAQVVFDSVYQHAPKELTVKLTMEVGNPYYVRNIEWKGNSLYTTETLDSVFGIKAGDIYDRSLMDRRLFYDPIHGDISALYMNKGYLFFQAQLVETLVEDSVVDVEIRLLEGRQAIVDRIILKGNVKTNDHVLLREIRSKPGDVFDRSAIIRSQQALAQLGMFDPEQMDVRPIPHPETGKVDLEYIVKEVIVDRFNLSGTWAPGNNPIGTASLNFKNFSMRNLFKKWDPWPMGDGQQLDISYQSAGQDYHAFSIGFTEPWVGGKKPRSLSAGMYYSYRADEEDGTLQLYGASAGYANRLKWPDDFAFLQQQFSYQRYILNDFDLFNITNGNADNVSYKLTLGRNNTRSRIYPRRGSVIKVSGMTGATNLDPASWHEYYKLKFSGTWYTPIDNKQKLILNTRVGFGYLGSFGNDPREVPFDRFFLGGSGFNVNTLEAREFIGLRGYEEADISTTDGDPVIAKYSMELRYPLILHSRMSIYGLAFAEAGNTWSDIGSFNPFDVKRSAGIGARLYLPNFGMFGIDYGWGFDNLENNLNFSPGSAIPTFTIGFNIGQL